MSNQEFIPVCEPFMGGREEEYVLQAVRTGWISSAGEFVNNFESGFASYCGIAHGVSTTSGTTALHLALLAAGIGEGDQVIIPDFTMVATLLAVLYCGATPVFVDVEPDTFNIDPALIEAKITSRTRAIIPVHIFGHPVDMAPIQELCQKHDLVIIEDAAEAHGAEYNGQRCGSLGDIACFSFFANKILTTGEGGMLLTDNPEYIKQARYFRNLCFSLDGPRDYSHKDLGYNYRFTNTQAAIGLAQLEKLDDYVEMRRANAYFYNSLLKDIPGVSLPVERKNVKNVYWMYGIMIDPAEFGMGRDELMAGLRDRGVDSRRYFSPMHDQPLLDKYKLRENDASYPVTEAAAANGLYLPSSSSLKKEQIERVCDTLRALRKNRV